MTTATAIVLAGGRSSRMGQPKAWLPFKGRPLIVHIVDTLQPLFEEVVVVAARGQELPSMNVRIVRDAVADQGPAAGLYYGLEAVSAEACFATSTDSAFLNADLIAYLLAQLADQDIVVPRWQGRLQPLHAIYRSSVLPHLRAQLAAGDLKLVSLLNQVRTRTVSEAEIRQFDPLGLSFFNMNSPDDYAEALRRAT